MSCPLKNKYLQFFSGAGGAERTNESPDLDVTSNIYIYINIMIYNALHGVIVTTYKSAGINGPDAIACPF